MLLGSNQGTETSNRFVGLVGSVKRSLLRWSVLLYSSSFTRACEWPECCITGCLIVEVHDHRQNATPITAHPLSKSKIFSFSITPSSQQDSPYNQKAEVYRIVLGPNPATLWTELGILSSRIEDEAIAQGREGGGEGFSQEQAVKMEAVILVRSSSIVILCPVLFLLPIERRMKTDNPHFLIPFAFPCIVSHEIESYTPSSLPRPIDSNISNRKLDVTSHDPPTSETQTLLFLWRLWRCFSQPFSFPDDGKLCRR